MPISSNLQVDQLTREIDALTEVAKTLTLPLDLPELLEAIMNKLIGVLEPAEVGVVMLWDQSAGLFRPAAAFGYDFDIVKQAGLRAGESITGKVYDEGVARLLTTMEEISEAMDDMRPANRAIMAQSLGIDELPQCTLAVPVTVENRKYGVLVLETIDGPALFNKGDILFVQSLADLIALAIDRARLSAKADAAREAREAERLRSELMATLSHELRMPLTAIKGYSTALLLDEVDWSKEKQLEFLQLIEEECDNMQVLLTDILDSSLTEVEQLTMQPQAIRIDKVAEDVSTEIQRRTDLHHLVVDFPPGFPVVKADPHWIKQVFRNVLDNAIKYSPQGGLVVIRGEKRPGDVVINIADQGIGISPENLIPLFEKYFRVKSSKDVHVPGMGLGLPIARTIIEAHGGRIWAESKEGQGTTLSFSLPRPVSLKNVEKGD
jgi:K+-sensing histidine kinase KdpD